jgi:hypothetical protein
MKVLMKTFLLCLMIAVVSCQKVIELPLNGNEPKYVIEGTITNEPGVCVVHLTQSVDFNAENIFPMVTGASVTVKDNGTSFNLPETSPGVYQSNAINGTPGHVYELMVLVNGKEFRASSTMPQPVHLDTLYIATGPFGQFKFPTISYTDPVVEDNGYIFVQYVNGKKDPAIFWDDDEFTNGLSVTTLLDNGVDKKDDPRLIHTGDLVTIEMQGVDENVLKYWYTLRTGGGTGGGNMVAPSNPTTNIQGGALGYFSAHTIDRKSVIAP